MTEVTERGRRATRKYLQDQGVVYPERCEVCGRSQSVPTYTHVLSPQMTTLYFNEVPILRPVYLQGYLRIVAHHYRGYAYPESVWFICVSCNRKLQHKHDGVMNLDQARVFVELFSGFSDDVYEVCKKKPDITEEELRKIFAEQLNLAKRPRAERRRARVDMDEINRLKIECEAGACISGAEMMEILTNKKKDAKDYECVPRRLMQTLLDLAVGAHISGKKEELIALGHAVRYPKKVKDISR